MKILGTMAFLGFLFMGPLATAMTCKDAFSGGWGTLSTDERISALQESQVPSENVALKDLKDANLVKEIGRAAKEIEREVGRDNIEEDLSSHESIFTIGAPIVVEPVEVFRSGDKIVAVMISLHQAGGASHDSEQAPPQKHYESRAEAEAAGLDVNADVSWQVHSYYQYDGRTLIPLQIDIYGEGGFSWSGW